MTNAVIGAQAPRIHVAPPYASSAGGEAIEVAEVAGLYLDPWEKLVLRDALGETADGRWATFRVGLACARQNGKGAVLEARELAGLFAFGERLIIHSAHEQATSSEHFERILNLLQGVPEFDRRILKVVRGKGSEAIKLRDGYRIFFKTRTGGGGRGFTGDLVVFDEAMILAAAFMAALVPTMAARSMQGDPQLWFAGSAVDRDKHEHGIEFARVRRDALALAALIGDEQIAALIKARLAYFDWSAPDANPAMMTAAQLDDVERWAMANPGMGIRISPGYIADERGALGPREFAVERLGVWDPPLIDDSPERAIDPEAWNSFFDDGSSAGNPVCFGVDMKLDRSSAVIGVAGWRPDGRRHLEIVEQRRGSDWVAPRLAELTRKHRAKGIEVPIDEGGPAGSLIPDIEKEGVAVRRVNTREYAQACGRIADRVDEDAIRHLGTDELTNAVAGALKRKLGDSWLWDRPKSTSDVSPLGSVTLALWGLETQVKPKRAPMIAMR